MATPTVPTESILDVITEAGVPFRVVVGRRHVLHSGWTSVNVVVAFYDRRYAGERFEAHGQFVSDYAPDTLLGLDPWDRGDRKGLGLDLWGGEPSWRIDGATMDLVRAWLARVAAPTIAAVAVAGLT